MSINKIFISLWIIKIIVINTNVILLIFFFVDLLDGVFDESVASYNSDEVLTGGGFVNTGNVNYIMNYSRPNGNSWEARDLLLGEDLSYTQAYTQCQTLVPDDNNPNCQIVA